MQWSSDEQTNDYFVFGSDAAFRNRIRDAPRRNSCVVASNALRRLLTFSSTCCATRCSPPRSPTHQAKLNARLCCLRRAKNYYQNVASTRRSLRCVRPQPPSEQTFAINSVVMDNVTQLPTATLPSNASGAKAFRIAHIHTSPRRCLHTSRRTLGGECTFPI